MVGVVELDVSLVDDVVLGGFVPVALDELVLVAFWPPPATALEVEFDVFVVADAIELVDGGVGL